MSGKFNKAVFGEMLARMKAEMPEVRRFDQSAAYPEMSDADVIARQAKQIIELRDEVDDLRGRMGRARSHICCVGGPLKGNALGYSKAQMVTFFRIADELVD